MTRNAKRKHILPLTYLPKIRGVIAGEIRQTIRVDCNYRVGDMIAFHGWLRVPYRSHWGFPITGYKHIKMTQYWELQEVIDVTATPHGLSMIREEVLPGGEPIMCRATYAWDLPCMDRLAARDGIVPATGKELKKVFMTLNKIPEKGVQGQILRW